MFLKCDHIVEIFLYFWNVLAGPPPLLSSSGLKTSGWLDTWPSTSTSSTWTWSSSGPCIQANCCCTKQYRTRTFTTRTSYRVPWTKTSTCLWPYTGEPGGATSTSATTTSIRNTHLTISARWSTSTCWRHTSVKPCDLWSSQNKQFMQ